MIFYEQPTDPWTPYDFKLLEAYQILQDETCNQCGNPIWICHSTDSNVTFKMQSSTCFAVRAEQRWAEDKKRLSKGKKKEWEPAPGEDWFPVPETVDGGPFPTRDDFYRSLG